MFGVLLEHDLRNWCFFENWKYAVNHDLPITFIIEDNNKSVCTDTRKTWNTDKLYFEEENKR